MTENIDTTEPISKASDHLEAIIGGLALNNKTFRSHTI